ncbi:TPA: hypothetical protein ACQ8NQ_002984 [Klebsiella pneumoniae]|nr:hypothetical protein [Klebsiella pneumoniae]HDG8021441.1 hypothetical protein [Klebsiella pneumoniae]
MASVINICNIALARIGNSRTINSLTEKTKEAYTCNLFYESMRDAVLADNDWNFAMSRVVLADLGAPAPGWLFRYQYPTDCARIAAILPKWFTGSHIVLQDKPVFEVGSNEDGTGRVIHTNESQAVLLYVKSITDPTMFDALFADALSWRMAAEIAMPIAANASLGQQAMANYQQVLTAAMQRSLDEAHEPQQAMSDLASARIC